MACEKQTFCSGRRMIKQILKRVSDSIYKPRVNKEIQQALESREGQQYVQALMHGLIAQNYILNMKFAGKITQGEFEALIELSKSKKGVEEIAVHTILSGVGSYAKFEGINVIELEPLEGPDKLNPNDLHVIEPLERSFPESEDNPITIKK